jgi:hypothetical protein
MIWHSHLKMNDSHSCTKTVFPDSENKQLYASLRLTPAWVSLDLGLNFDVNQLKKLLFG